MQQRHWLAAGVALSLFGLACAPAAGGPTGEPQAMQDKPQYGGVLNLANSVDAPTLDLHASSTVGTSLPVQPATNPLVRYDPLDPVMAKIEPNMAERWEVSPDGKIYTFYLRKGVKFHQGGDLTAADVQFSFERQQKPEKGQVRPRKDAFERIDRYEVVNDSTLRIVMKRPYPSFLANIAQGWMAIYDKEWVESGHDPAKEVNGTGPFVFKEYIRGTSTELVKNTSYWKEGRPYLDGIKYFIIPDRGTTLAACRTGQIAFCGIRTSEVESFQKELGDKIRLEKSTEGLSSNHVNLSVLRKPFDDVRVRRALAYALDREAAIKVLFEGEGYTQGYLPGKGQWALPTSELAKYPGFGPDVEKNRAEARKLLAEAGYPNGFKVTINIRQIANSEDAGVFIKDQWEKIGVIGTLKVIETQAAYEIMGKGDYEVFNWVTTNGMDDPDAIFSEHFLCGAPRNYPQLCVPEIDALFEKQTAATDPAERKRLVNEMERATLNAMVKPILPIGTNNATVIWNTLQNWRLQVSSYSNRHFDEAWLASK